MTERLPDVNDVYKRIFADDPFLLRAENQDVFGQQILRNLLIERALTSSEPMDVSLDDPTSRDQFKAVQTPPSDPVSEALKTAYRASRMRGKPLAQKDFDDLSLRTMVAKPELTMDRLDKELADDRDAQDAMATSGSPLDKRLKIAAVGYRVKISRIPDGGFFSEELSPRPATKEPVHFMKPTEQKTIEKLRRTKARPDADGDVWFEAITRHIKLALERRSHFVLLPEFALPPDLGRTPRQHAIKELADGAEHEFFLFSGSRHEGAHNRGFLLSREHGHKGATPIWWHYKVASARGLGENIMGPQSRRLPSYNFKLQTTHDGNPVFCKIFVALCYDVFDPTTFINYVVQCADSDDHMHQNIILVPSFNPGRVFVHALRDLSFIAKCPVIYVNGLHGDARLFLFGVEISDLVTIEKETKSSAGGNATQGSPFDTAVKSVMETLKTNSVQATQQFQAAIAARKSTENRAVRKKLYDLSRSISERKVVSDAQLGALEVFHAGLDSLRKEGALKHLITTERCEHCHAEEPTPHEYCPTDLVYFNIDLRLLRLLKVFRTEYFRWDEDFLPLPFRDSERKKIFNKIEEKREERESRASPT